MARVFAPFPVRSFIPIHPWACILSPNKRPTALIQNLFWTHRFPSFLSFYPPCVVLDFYPDIVLLFLLLVFPLIICRSGQSFVLVSLRPFPNPRNFVAPTFRVKCPILSCRVFLLFFPACSPILRKAPPPPALAFSLSSLAIVAEPAGRLFSPRVSLIMFLD